MPASEAEAQARALGDALGRAVAFPGDLVTLENSPSLKLATVENRLEARIDTTKTELKLDLGGRIETLKWMFGAQVALDVGILVRLLYIQ